MAPTTNTLMAIAGTAIAGSAFLPSFGVSTTASTRSPAGLRGAPEASDGISHGVGVVSVGLAASLCVAGVAAARTGRRSTAARKATPGHVAAQIKADSLPNDEFPSGGFSSGRLSVISAYRDQEWYAGGLVGSEMHGFGTYVFDPLDLAISYPESLPWFREAELKHGRIAMLAMVGLIAPDAFRIPLDVFASKDLNAITAHKMLIGPGLGEGPMWMLLLFCGAIESLRFRDLGLGFEKLNVENAGNNFGKAFLPTTEESSVSLKMKELKNGRLAMFAFGGCVTQGVLFNSQHFPFLPGA